MAIGGCFCNDLRCVAHDMGVELSDIAVEATLKLDGTPLLAIAATVCVSVTAREPDINTGAIVRRAREISTVWNSVARGFPVDLV